MNNDENDTGFEALLENSKWRFETQGLRASDRAYEYGLFVVKNAMLVSGGGLFFIPTMVGLSADVSLEWAFFSGMMFGGCVLLTLIANYMIHWNWMLIERSYEDIYEIEKIQTRSAFERSYSSDDKELERLERALSDRNRWVNFLFYGAHTIAVSFVGLFGAAAYCLYQAFFLPIG